MSSLSRIGREAYEHAILYLALCCFVLVGVLNTAVSTALYLILPRRAGIWFGRRTIGWVFRSYLAMLNASGVLRLDLTDLDRVRNDRSVIIAPNHPCLLDAVLVIS
ncbi:MAG: 1-acyl-sn-glycerol-3-phosphate acyltransferase, partial [Burkholderiales bacterium]